MCCLLLMMFVAMGAWEIFVEMCMVYVRCVAKIMRTKIYKMNIDIVVGI